MRAQAEFVRRTRSVLEQVVNVSREMLAVGKGRQPDVLRGQTEFQKMREMLLSLENRERVLSIRLNVLASLPAGEPVPAVDNLAEFSPSFDAGKLMETYAAERPRAESRRGPHREGRDRHSPGGERTQARLRSIRLLHAAGLDARRNQPAGPGFRHGVDDPSRLGKEQDRPGDPCGDRRTGDGLSGTGMRWIARRPPRSKEGFPP